MDNRPYEERIIRRGSEQGTRLGRPPAWAQSRDDLAATTEWFRQYEAGFYQKDGTFYGLLIAGYAGERSYMDAEILITSINGEASAINARAGKFTHTASRVEAVRRALRERTRVGVIAQKDSANRPAKKKRGRTWSPLFPVAMDPGHESWVVDWFWVLDLWPENRDCGIVWMIRLEKLGLEKRSYWAKPGQHPPAFAQRDFLNKAPRTPCSTCNNKTPEIFNEGFICRNQDCSDFWKMNGRTPPVNRLTYSDEWLKERSYPPTGADERFYPDFNTWHQVNYFLPQQISLNDDAVLTLSRNLTQNFCCPWCQRVNRRIEWARWKCFNAACAFEAAGHPPEIPVRQIVTLSSESARRQKRPFDFTSPKPYKETQTVKNFTIYHYEFAKDCNVSYCLPREGTNEAQGGSDSRYMEVLRLANGGAISLKRVPAKSKTTSALTGHFAGNFGHEYSYGSMYLDTTTFEESPPEIAQARDMAQRVSQRFFGKDDEPFNELYLAAYFDEMGMAWHDDGETGVGPVITTWTLGGRGSMKFGLKRKYWKGRYRLPGNQKVAQTPVDGEVKPGDEDVDGNAEDDKDGGRDENDDDQPDDPPDETPQAKGKNPWLYITDDPVPQGCANYDERLKLRQRLDSGKITQTQWAAAFKKLVDKVDPRNTYKSPVEVLEVPLLHGSFVVMHGKDMQKIYEHKIDVHSPFRFALTFRSIGDENNTVMTGKLGKGTGSKRTKDGGDGGGKRQKLEIETRDGQEFVKGTQQPARSVYDEGPDDG